MEQRVLFRKGKQREVYNEIEVGNMRIVTNKGSINDVMRVADKILTKHKKLIAKKKEDPYLPIEMFG